MAKQNPAERLSTFGERKIVSWEDPPPRPSANRVYDEIAAQLKENAGKWARPDDRGSANAAMQFATQVRNGKVAAFRPSGDYDATYNGASVWVRYIGGSMDLRSPGARY